MHGRDRAHALGGDRELGRVCQRTSRPARSFTPALPSCGVADELVDPSAHAATPLEAGQRLPKLRAKLGEDFVCGVGIAALAQQKTQEFRAILFDGQGRGARVAAGLERLANASLESLAVLAHGLSWWITPSPRPVNWFIAPDIPSPKFAVQWCLFFWSPRNAARPPPSADGFSVERRRHTRVVAASRGCDPERQHAAEGVADPGSNLER